MSARHALIVLLILVAAACERTDAQPEARTESGTNQTPASTPIAERNDPLERPPVDVALLPSSTREMLSRLSPRDRDLVESFYRSYGDSVIAFSNKHELLWMIQHGYPMPEDVLEAATLSDQELKARYEAGDVKAGFFLLDRMTAAIENGKTDFDSKLDATMLANKLLISGSPFSGYAYYRHHRRLQESQSDALAGLLWADWQGDYRAAFQLMELTGNGSRFDSTDLPTPATVAIAYQALLSTVRARNPALLTRKIDPLLQKKNM